MGEQPTDILEFLIGCCEGTATETEMVDLDRLLKEDPQTLEYAIELLMNVSCLQSYGRASSRFLSSGHRAVDADEIVASNRENLSDPLRSSRFQFHNFVMRMTPRDLSSQGHKKQTIREVPPASQTAKNKKGERLE